MRNKFTLLFTLIFILIGCGSVIVETASSDSTGAGGSKNSVSSISSSSGVGGKECIPGQFIPGTDGGPDGGETLCCESGTKLCLDVCCEFVAYEHDGGIDYSQNCAGNFELGYCCPRSFHCIKP